MGEDIATCVFEHFGFGMANGPHLPEEELSVGDQEEFYSLPWSG